MKRFNNSLLLSLLALLLSLSMQNYHSSLSSSLAHASKTGPTAIESNNGIVAEYHPLKKKGVIGRAFDWGLAKLDQFDGILVSDLFTAFVTKCDDIFAIMLHSFKEITLSYDELHDKEVERLAQFDQEFSELVKLRNKIDRNCLYSRSMEETSLCIDKGMEIQDKIQTLRSQRVKSTNAVERYEEMMAWCASYNNWFC